MKTKNVGLSVLGSLLIIPQMTFAVNTQAVREECFNTLKQNITEIGTLEEAEKEFADLSYSDVENKLSKNYKNLSSFGIDVDEALFEQKVWSFGAQTGYIHPPFSPFPIYTKADKWETPAKQNIYSEEFVRDEKGALNFLSCAFFRAESEDLMNITSEKYLYDGELISVLKTDENEKYKAWYNENTSYDHENKPFVSWKRLFVYPASSINSYFNRFSVADAFPSNPSDTLDLFKPKKMEASTLPPELLAKVKEQTGKENPTEEDIMSVIGDGGGLRIYAVDQDGQIKTSVARKELMPVQLPENTVFGLKSYYDGIENYFPNFAKHLALRGSLKYETLKKLIADKDAPEMAHIWATILDTREITKYALKKEKGEIEVDSNSFYETSLQKIPTIEQEAESVLEEIKIEKQKEVKAPIQTVETPNEEVLESKFKSYLVLGLGSILAIILLFVLFTKSQKKKKKSIF